MTGGYEDNFVGPTLCFTLRGQSDIREIPDPENVFKALFLGRVRVHGKKAGSDPIPGGMPTLQSKLKRICGRAGPAERIGSSAAAGRGPTGDC